LLKEITALREVLKILAALFTEQQSVLEEADGLITKSRRAEASVGLRSSRQTSKLEEGHKKLAQEVDKMYVDVSQAYENVSSLSIILAKY
jgi:hypothetical protein